MLLSAATLFAGFLVILFYAIPAISIHLMVWGLADPRREVWSVPPEAHAWKERYRRGAFFGQYLNLFLFGLFLVQAIAAFTLERFECASQTNHLSAAAWNLVVAVDQVWTIGFFVLAAGAAAALAWAVMYYVQARKHEWPDPRRRDALLVHVFIVPLALLLLYVAFAILVGTFCPTGR